MKAFLFLSVLALSSVGFSSQAAFDRPAATARAKAIIERTRQIGAGDVCRSIMHNGHTAVNAAAAAPIKAEMITLRDEAQGLFNSIPTVEFGVDANGESVSSLLLTAQVIAGQTAMVADNPFALQVGDSKIDAFRAFKESDCPQN
jgi:hypothetical protein